MENKDLREMIKNMFIDFPEPETVDGLLDAIREGCGDDPNFKMPERRTVEWMCKEMVIDRILEVKKNGKYGPTRWFTRQIENGMDV